MSRATMWFWVFLALVLKPQSATAEIPDLCCPSSCVSASSDLMIVSVESGQVAVMSQDGEMVPFARNFHLGPAADNRVHICFSFNSFGDREVKCLLTPPMS